MVLANTVMSAEIPSPTMDEGDLVRHLCDRFNESGLLNISSDEAGNAIGLLPGKRGKDGKNILVAAHVDKVWERGIDHTMTVTAEHITGPGIADNSLGVGAVVSLPLILEKLGIELEHNVILLGASRSMGRGDLGGLRFFLENTQSPVASAICVEGIEIGRLSYSSLGMNRCEVRVRVDDDLPSTGWGSSGAVPVLSRVIDSLLAIPLPQRPKTEIIMGSILAGTTYNVPPAKATLRFEVRSETPGEVARVREAIDELVAVVNAEEAVTAELRILARRRPGGINFSHPLVKSVRETHAALGIETYVTPSISELSVLLDADIPSVTLGITHGTNKHATDERVEIEPIFTGLAQIIAVLLHLDESLSDE